MARLPGSQMAARLQHVNTSVSARLDRIGGYFPERRETMPFPEYLARASVQAQSDPIFGAELAAALRQYQTASEVLHGANKQK